MLVVGMCRTDKAGKLYGRGPTCDGGLPETVKLACVVPRLQRSAATRLIAVVTSVGTFHLLQQRSSTLAQSRGPRAYRRFQHPRCIRWIILKSNHVNRPALPGHEPLEVNLRQQRFGDIKIRSRRIHEGSITQGFALYIAPGSKSLVMVMASRRSDKQLKGKRRHIPGGF